MNVFDYTPLTFVLDLDDQNCDMALNSFVKFFEINMPTYMKKNNSSKHSLDIRRKLRPYYQHSGGASEKQISYYYTRHRMFNTYLSDEKSSYLWLLKPTFLNRGRGIHIFNDLNHLEKLINEYYQGFEEKSV